MSLGRQEQEICGTFQKVVSDTEVLFEDLRFSGVKILIVWLVDSYTVALNVYGGGVT
jgi:hypothetical protein